MIAADGDGIKVSDRASNERFLYVTHHAQREFGRENAGVLRLIFLENVGLNRTAHRTHCVTGDLFVRFLIYNLVTRDAEQP